jgi:hypothetical protein
MGLLESKETSIQLRRDEIGMLPIDWYHQLVEDRRQYASNGVSIFMQIAFIRFILNNRNGRIERTRAVEQELMNTCRGFLRHAVSRLELKAVSIDTIETDASSVPHRSIQQNRTPQSVNRQTRHFSAAC